MGDRRLSSDAYESVATKIRSSGGTSTFAGEQRKKKGEGLHPFVDPSVDPIRRSLNRHVEKDGVFVLVNGIAILKETRFDTTGSMGGSVDEAFASLPKSYHLLAEGAHAVLGRYDTQIITSIFNDMSEDPVLLRSQAEMDVKIAEQMTYMVPLRSGGDGPEDPHYGIFGAAYLTDANINKYGLKSYDFTVSDADAHDRLSEDILYKVFGKEVFDKVKENGYQVDKKNLPSIKEMVAELGKRAHAFFLQVDGYGSQETNRFWSKIYGKERMVQLPSANLLAETEAAIIGLTEGVLTLSTLPKFLTEQAGLSEGDATLITRAVAGIPMGAQKVLPGFDKIPSKGSVFKAKRDVDPMEDAPSKTTTDKSSKKKKKSTWG